MLKNNIKCWRIIICAKRTMNIPMKNDHRFGFGPLRLLWLLLCFISLSTSALWADSKILLDSRHVESTSLNKDTCNVCGFDKGRNPIRMFVENATDSCLWELDAGVGSVRPFRSADNMNGDTVNFVFDAALNSGWIKVKMKSNPSVVVAKVFLRQIPKANVAKDITWDAPICQNLYTTFIVPTDTNKYAPGVLNIRWTLMDKETQEVNDGFSIRCTDAKNNDCFENRQIFDDDFYANGKIAVTPYTCDVDNLRTTPTMKDLVPFIKKGLYDPTKDKIHQLKPNESKDKDENAPLWMVETDNRYICRSYDEEWNSLNGRTFNGQTGLVYLEFGDYYTWKNSADTTKLPECYYKYKWEYDRSEFRAETDLMEKNSYIDEGFGLDKTRIILRVVAEGSNKVHKVKLTVWCDTCIKRGGAEADFTYTTTIVLNRQDSISNFKDETHPITYSIEAEGETCAGQQTTLRLHMDEDSKKYYGLYSNATEYTLFPQDRWGSSAKWEEITENCGDAGDGGGSGGPGGGGPPPSGGTGGGEGGATGGEGGTGGAGGGEGGGTAGEKKIKELFCFTTARTTEKPGVVGDTVYVLTYPTNECFQNLWRTTQNGQVFKVYVKNPPTKPVIHDPASGRKINGLYTKARWDKFKKEDPNLKDQDESTTQRVLMCNYNAQNSGEWLRFNQTYGLQVENDSLLSTDAQNDPYVFRLVDYEDNIGSKKVIRELEDRFTVANPKKDSSWVYLTVARDAKADYAYKTFKLGFYSFNICGLGDTAIFFFKVIDTITAVDIKEQDVDDWDTLCEGTILTLSSSTQDNHVGYSDLSIARPWESITTDRLIYNWKMPDSTWKYVGNTDSTKSMPSVMVGRNSGPVKLRFGNRCGYGSYKSMPVVVHPYVRVNIKGDPMPCQGDTVTYSFKRAELTDEYEITFPYGWEAISHASPPGSQVSKLKDKDVQGDSVIVQAVAVPYHDQRSGWQNGTRRPITVVGSKGDVPGVPDGCNFTLNNPKNIDSLVVGIKPHPMKPIIDGDFPKLLASPIDTVCAGKVYTFQVKDTSRDDDNITFSWLFPTDQWVRSGNSAIYDTVTFSTPDTSSTKPKLSVKVVANRNDCAGNNRKLGFPKPTSDTLEIKLLLMDTLPVTIQPGQSPFVDILKLRPDGVFQALNKRPCEGDTVCYVVKRRQDPSVYYAQFDWRPLGGTDSDATPFDEVDRTPLTSSGWKMLSEAPYHDTLKMVVGRAPMRLRAANVSLCDTSSYKEDTIRPVSKVIASGQIKAVRPDDNLCEYEAVAITFDTVQYATHYVFHYPWGKQTDTLLLDNRAADVAAGIFTNEGRYKMSFGDTLAYAAGKVYVEAYNSCGVRPTNDELTIASVLRRQAAPVLKQVDFEDFVADAVHTIGADSVLDTLCLRHPMVLKAEPANATAALASGWQFRYAWTLTQTDATVTKFEKYKDAAWSNSDANNGDSLWTLTKEVSPTTTTYLWLTSRHKTCDCYGDTLTIALRNIDTTALKEGDAIVNYIYDKVAEKDGKRVKIQTMPCAASGSEVAYYLDLASLDITGKSYYFRWRIDSTKAFENLYDATDKTMAGSKFVLKNVPADNNGDGIPDWTTLDTLKIKIPADVDSLEVQVVITNRCEEAQMPGFEIRTTNAISEQDVYIVKRVSDYICDQEKLTYKVFSLIPNGDKVDTLPGTKKANNFIWYTPWHEKSDTVLDGASKTFDTIYKPGTIYVVPFNGCGDGHRSDSVTVRPVDILRPPLRVQPVPTIDFASTYDPAGEPVSVIRDSACLRTDMNMVVRAELSTRIPPESDKPQDVIKYAWALRTGKASALQINETDSTKATLRISDFADSICAFYVAARLGVCQRYGDSLRIEIFPMDTLRFLSSAVEDSLPYDRFTVLTRGVIQDIYPTPPSDSISMTPCEGGAVTYSIKPKFHWSLVSSPAPSFSWNGGKTGTTPAGMLEGTTGWHCGDVSKLPGEIHIDKVGLFGDVLALLVHAKNICGTSTSGPVVLNPQALIDPDDKPVFKPLKPICEKDTVWVEIEPVTNATHYAWTTKFPIGTQKDTTTVPKIGYANYDALDATVSVQAFNTCGTGLESEVLEIKPLLRIPSRPKATWYNGLPMVGDTVFDTLCIRNNNLLSVKSDLVDGDESSGDGVFYNWAIMPSSENAAEWLPLPGHAPGGRFDGHDSIYLKPDPLEIANGGHIRLMVSARRRSCPNYWSDTLYIDITMTDFVSIASLGRLIWYDPATAGLTPIIPSMPLCPGTIMRIGVENASAAPAYHWDFPSNTWRFADGFTDTTNSVVDVKVGHHAGRIYVSPLTDAESRRCKFDADTTTALSSDPVTLKEALSKREFVAMGLNFFNDAPCAGTPVKYEINGHTPEELAMGLKYYRWEFPSGWRAYEEDDVTLTNSNVYITKTLTPTCKVLPSSDSGKVRVYALSVCDPMADPPSLSQSEPVERVVNPIDTARLEIVADETVCKDSTLVMEVKPLNSLTATGYSLSVRYFGTGSDAAVIDNPTNPLVIRFPNRPDSSLLEVDWYSGDSVNLIFTPKNTKNCPNNVQPAIYALKADTIPAIGGRISGPTRVCMEALETFEVSVDLDTAETKVFYRWELPIGSGWEIVKGGDSSVVVIRVGVYENAELKQTIRCYPRALCGTGEPFEYELTINPPAEFKGTMAANYLNRDGSVGEALTPADRPCIGTNLKFTFTHDEKPSSDNIQYTWEMPRGWNRLAPIDNRASMANFTASRAGADTMRVRYRDLNDPNSCGLSRALSYPVFIRDSAPAARLTRPPYPCESRTEIDFVLVPDEEIDAATWTTPADDPATAADYVATPATDAGSRIVRNRLNLKKSDGSAFGLNRFNISIRTVNACNAPCDNACGGRDTTIEVRPVSPISALSSDSLRVSHYCVGDSAYAYVGIPDDYLGQGVEYSWRWEPDTALVRLFDSIVYKDDILGGDERIVWLYFKHAPTSSAANNPDNPEDPAPVEPDPTEPDNPDNPNPDNPENPDEPGNPDNPDEPVTPPGGEETSSKSFLRNAKAAKSAAGPAPDTVTLVFYTSNDCVGESLTPVTIRTAPYTYLIGAKAGADTALYAQTGISLSVDYTQFGTPADYFYVWQPKHRVQKQVSEDGDTTYATKGLYMRWEQFDVTSTERIDTAQPFYARPSACQSRDTIRIYVDSTFTVVSSPIDSACLDAPYTLSVYPYGGNTSSYRFDWYRLSDDSVYELIPEVGNEASITLETIDTALIRFMVIGRDSISVASEDSIYQYTYNPDNNEVIDSVLVPVMQVFSQIDTQYIELRSFTVGGRMVVPSKESIAVPLGTMVRLSAEATGGSGQYVYRWETDPADKMDSPDSTRSQAVTRRIYDDCDVNLTIRDTLTGCNALLKVHIGLSDEFGEVPNAFSPNGDGKNDVFMPGTDLVIFNRFGQELFRSTEAQEGWDGTYKGKVVADGDYLYVLTINRNERTYTKRGTVTVITKPVR